MTHPRLHARAAPDRPAVIMSDGSSSLSYGELEDRANRGARLIRSLGIAGGQTIAFWLPNCPEVFEVYWAAQRAGIYVTPIATALTAAEADYIIGNSGAKLVVVSHAIAGLAALPPRDGVTVLTLEQWRGALASQPPGAIDDEAPGFHMVYSSGTTGRPKGIRLPLPTGKVTDLHQLAAQIRDRYGLGPDDTYLSPAPLYHTAPLAYTTAAHRLGATVVVMPKFEPEAWLDAVEAYRVTMTQMVPTMFVRLLKLPEEARKAHDLSSLRHVIHAAAPCPVPVKHAMIEWLGPILYEYYGGSEGNGSTGITSEEWLKKPGSVGRATWGTLHICDDAGNELPAGEQGLVYFEGGWDFQYLGDPDKTRDSRNPLHPAWSALGDVGYVDRDGYLFLTDRKSYMIISGGVNIYPQEVENLLITHPKVADAAVIGVPNPDFGEEVKAVVQALDPADATPAFAEELIAFCKEGLSPIKCPRSIDFDLELPRLDNGKLYKRLIKDRYWARKA
ncbi:acyl-CoA synthetase (AMP-forming)/AMP-acid ligase II [Novosphingobium kunmingense]|uniref:Acyl-CoA synthetase (AMP-forming)/AMP-acid ligase II n=1 Tax=Novosphingobium kunmingense TaxID=1211806 RepID=A0A2N0H608_9SPHN|nr:acyl-CoA synthetase [Novosphingobium kunmingense]PKB14401.1 acyl-CoA synthetase (AMP-forming)/AMP-acid ligase II [Novosphingobium kunmingense]